MCKKNKVSSPFCTLTKNQLTVKGNTKLCKATGAVTGAGALLAASSWWVACWTNDPPIRRWASWASWATVKAGCTSCIERHMGWGHRDSLCYLSVALTWALTHSTQTCFFTISIKGQSTHSCRSNPTGCHSLKKRVVFEKLWESTPRKQGVSPRIPGVQRGLRRRRGGSRIRRWSKQEVPSSRKPRNPSWPQVQLQPGVI